MGDYPRTPSVAAALAGSFAPIHPTRALEDLVKEHEALERAKREAATLKEREDLPDIPGLKTKAWTHQRQAFHFARKLPGALLWMHMGTGKSLVTLGLIHDKQPRVAIAFAPKRALRVWPAEFKKHGLAGYRVIVLDKNGTAANLKHLEKELAAAEANERVVVVVNYEAAWRDELARALKALRPEMLVADEGHRIKSHKLDAEYPIVGHKTGVGKFDGAVIWVCQMHDGKTFDVVPRGTMEERRAWYAQAETHYGSMLNVRYFEVSEDGIPRFPVGAGIRAPEDMD